MNAYRHIVPLCAVLATAASADAPKSVVRFSNSDVLPGTPQAITPQHLVWNSPLLERPTPFLLGKVLDVSLSPAHPEETTDHTAVVTLTNGDVIRGQLASVAGDSIALDTWFAGRMSFKRPVVSRVKIEQHAGLLYRGPSGLDGWKQSEPPAWTYQRAAFRSISEGGIARPDVLPEECSVSFDAAWKGDSVRLRLVLFSDDPSTDNPSTGYDISFMRGSVHARNCKTQNFLGSAQSAALLESDKVHIEIRASTKTKRIALFINGRITEVWNDAEGGKVIFGRGLHFVAASPTPMRVSNIRVAPWDGVIDKMPEPRPGFNRRFGVPDLNEDDEPATAEPKAPVEERMELANGDTLAGEVSAIQNGTMTVKSPLGEIRLPVSRLRSVLLKPVEAETAKRYNGDVRAWFPDGGSVVFRLESAGDDTLTGFSQNFGTATFKTAAFSGIEFNIYSPDYEDIRRADDW